MKPARLPDVAAPFRRIRVFRGLAGRLLAVTVSVFLLGEILVFAPALANFHETWLRDRINLAQTAALALEAAPGNDIAQPLQTELLENAEVKRIALKREGERELLLSQPLGLRPGERLILFDYTRANHFTQMAWAWETLLAPRGRVLRVLAEPRFDSGEKIDIVLNEAPLKRAMGAYALQTIGVSTLISLLAGGIVYLVLSFAFVRPMRRLTAAIERFRAHPEDASIPFRRSSRADEIGRAERAAAEMADELRANLRQRERLALLGGAVARIAHDLRNMLATAQIVSERLAASDDPKVRQIAPRLERAIGRAAGLASSAARFGRADEEAPVLRPVKLKDAAAEALGDALAAFPQVSVHVDIEDDAIVIADADHVHRILVNLLRNAAQAIATREKPAISIHSSTRGEVRELHISDNGPGVPPASLERLFQPFASANAHGVGLGLAIARELARAQGGDVSLARSGREGACFQVSLPAA